MSLPSLASQRAADVPATPTSALPTSSLGTVERVLSQAPLETEKPTATLLTMVAADIARPERFDQYMHQVYGTPAGATRRVTSFEHLREELSRFASVGHLVLIGHSFGNDFKIGTRQLTCSQFAAEFAGKVPPIGELSFDGCLMGANPSGLREIATALGCSMVRGWSWFHYLDWWRVVPTGDVDVAVAAFLPAAGRAAPYLPKSLDGKTTYSAAEQEQLYRRSSLALIGEYFIESVFDAGDPDFETAVLSSALDPSVHRTRASAETRVIDSADAQSGLEAELASSRPPLARVSVKPWQ